MNCDGFENQLYMKTQINETPFEIYPIDKNNLKFSKSFEILLNEGTQITNLNIV
jgi:hypothetical protein